MLSIKEYLKHHWNNRFIRFFVIGGINTIFGYSHYAFLLFMGLHYSLATGLGSIGGILIN